MGTLQDDLWIWGHDAGSHHQPPAAMWKIPGVNRMGPWEGAEYLGGIPNCCMVSFNGQPKPPFDDASRKLTQVKKVVWSALGDKGSVRNDNGADDLDEVLRQAEKFPNVTGAILDDLFRAETKDARVTVERMKEMRRKRHAAARPLELWVVYYSSLFGIDYSAWLDSADVISFWSWTSEDLFQAEKNLDAFIGMTPEKKHYAGCYLYNFGDLRPMTREEMEFQLALYLRFWKEKKIDGMIVCSNTVADVGLEAVEIFRKWAVLHGGETR